MTTNKKNMSSFKHHCNFADIFNPFQVAVLPRRWSRSLPNNTSPSIILLYTML